MKTSKTKTLPTAQEIVTEIAELKRLSNLIPATTLFGDNNIAAIEAEIRALEGLWTEDDAYDEFPEDADAVKDQLDPDMEDEEAEQVARENCHALDAALNAIAWQTGETNEKPSDGWAPLVKGKS